MTIAFSEIGIYPRTEKSLDSAHFGPALPDGATIQVECEAEGAAVNGNPIWERRSDGAWIPNAFVNTGYDTWTPGIPRCDQQSSPAPADSVAVDDLETRRQLVASLATSLAGQHPDGSYEGRENNCTRFVSAVLAQAGYPMTDEWYSWEEGATLPASRRTSSDAWASADHFKNWALASGHAAEIREIPQGQIYIDAQVGDIIGYDMHQADPNDLRPDGTLDHLMIVTRAGTSVTTPLIAQSSPWRVNRDWRTGWENYPNMRAYVLKMNY